MRPAVDFYFQYSFLFLTGTFLVYLRDVRLRQLLGVCLNTIFDLGCPTVKHSAIITGDCHVDDLEALLLRKVTHKNSIDLWVFYSDGDQAQKKMLGNLIFNTTMTR